MVLDHESSALPCIHVVLRILSLSISLFLLSGSALAIEYARPGVFLALTGRNEEKLSHIKAECEAKGATVETRVLAVTDAVAMRDWITGVDEAHPFDLAIANAGVASSFIVFFFHSFSGSSHHHFNFISPSLADQLGLQSPANITQQIFETNFYGVVNTIFPLLPRMEVFLHHQHLLPALWLSFFSFCHMYTV